MAAPLPDVDGDPRALVLVVLDGFDFTLAHADILADPFGDFGVGSGGALFGGVLEDELRQRNELVAGIAELGAGHVVIYKGE